jgi:hypothetical protein
MLEDLNRYFNFNAHIEIRDVPTLVFRLDSNFNHLQNHCLEANTGRKETLVYDNLVQFNILDSVVNKPFTALIRRLSASYYSSPPMIDETHLGATRVTMFLGLNYAKGDACYNEIDIAAWKAAFSKYGILLSIENRPTEVMVVNDVWLN